MSNRKSKKPSHHSPQSVADNRQSRRAVLAALGALGVGAAATIALQRPASVQQALGILEDLPATDALPVVFVGHGTPFSIIDPNVWTREWNRIGGTLPRPAAILMISAHWLNVGRVSRDGKRGAADELRHQRVSQRDLRVPLSGARSSGRRA
jgi:hypothetical protein